MGLVVRTLLRRALGSMAVLSVVGALVFGGSLAALSGARRSATALDRFLKFSAAEDVYVTPSENGPDIEVIDALPQVAAAAYQTYLALVPEGDDGHADPADFGSISPYLYTPVVGPPDAIGRRRVIAGRDYDPTRSNEAVVDEELAASRHLRPGSHLRMVGFTPAQIPELFSGPESPAPAGPVVDLTITGIVRRPVDVHPTTDAAEMTYGSTMDMYISPAFYRAHADVASFDPPEPSEAQAVLLRHDADDIPAFEASIAALPGGGGITIQRGGSDAEDSARTARRGIAVETLCLYGLAAALALAGAALVGQGLARLARRSASDLSTLRALGMGPSALVGVAAAPGAVVVVLSALTAPLVALSASGLSPIGLGRTAEVAPGIRVDTPILVLGGVALLAAGLAAAGLSARPTVRSLQAATASLQQRTSRLADAMAAAGAPFTSTLGARFALEPSARRRAPLRYAVGVGGVAFIVVAAVTTYGASLEHLVEDRALQGATWDITLGNPNASNYTEDDRQRLLTNPVVAGASAVVSTPSRGTVGGLEAALAGIDQMSGAVGPRVVTGRMPTAPREVALGLRTAAKLGVTVGDRVRVSLDGVEESMTIVGTAVLNPGLSSTMDIGSGAVVTVEQLQRLVPYAVVNVMLVRVAPGVSTGEAIASLEHGFTNVGRPAPAVEVVNLHRVRSVPIVLAEALAAAALALLGVALVASSRERRREVGVLRSLGATRRQIAATLLWQGMWLYVGALAGLPVGIAVGRTVWDQVALRLGVLAGAEAPYAALARSALIGFVFALVLSGAPALRAASMTTARALRTD